MKVFKITDVTYVKAETLDEAMKACDSFASDDNVQKFWGVQNEVVYMSEDEWNNLDDDMNHRKETEDGQADEGAAAEETS